MNLFLIKITIIPAVIALVTLAIRKWGNKVGGLIGSMPWVAGPILLFFILEQGTAFGIRSIQGSMTGLLALVSFVFSYIFFSRKFTWLPTILLAFVFYTATVLLVNAFPLSLATSYGLAMGSVVLALWFCPVPKAPAGPVRRLPFDIFIRMGVATVFVVLITGLANLLGPTWSGILTPFPIMTSVLAIFSHVLGGSNGAITTLRGLLIGLLGFTTFLFLQAYWLNQFSVGLSFSLALIVNTVINLIASRIW